MVVTLGVTAMLHCLDLKTGAVKWKHDLAAEYQVPQEFFGHGATPLIHEGKVFVNVGGKGEKIDGSEDQPERMRKLATPGVCVAAFDLQTGKELWQVKDEWGASYANPILATLHGEPRLLVFAGGESNPVIGGLLCLDPKDGKVYDRTFWRADMYTSVNASSPVVIAEKNRVFVTTAYPKGRPIGGLMLEYDAQWKAKAIWRSTKIACHWMTPLHIDGFLYAIDGETERQAELVCVNADTGEEKWREEILWDMPVKGQRYKMSILRASLLQVDGKILCLGETGSLHWLELSPDGCKELKRTQLWVAPHTWSLPVISKGLLYVGQHERDQIDASEQRFICYDLRAP
jgi:outer membrane protein assembly factor BamB